VPAVDVIQAVLMRPAKRGSAKMNRVVNSTFRNIPGGVRIENGLERSECCAFPARSREIWLCRCKFLLSSTEVRNDR
jgi:hypothetical protein